MDIRTLPNEDQAELETIIETLESILESSKSATLEYSGDWDARGELAAHLEAFASNLRRF